MESRPEVGLHDTLDSLGEHKHRSLLLQSIFLTQLQSMKWKGERAAAEMSQLLGVRSAVLSLLEQARRQKSVQTQPCECDIVLMTFYRHIKSSLEAEVKIIYPSGDENERLVQLLKREGKALPFPRIRLLQLTYCMRTQRIS